MFNTLYIGQRDNRLCPHLLNWATLYPLPLSQLQESSVLISLLYSSSPPSSASAAAASVSLAPASSMPVCYHHRISTHAPCFLSTTSQRSRSGRVAIYCRTVFCLRRMYVSIGSNPASALAAAVKVYSHFQSSLFQRSRPVSRHSTWPWRLPRPRPM